MKIHKIQLFCNYSVVIMLLFAGCSSIAMAEFTKIDVYKKIIIDHERILLGDIAKIEGNDNKYIERLKLVYIGRSPLPGKKQSVGKRHIMLRLKENKIDILGVGLSMNKAVEITRSCTVLKQKKIKEIVKKFVHDNILQKHDGSRIIKIYAGKDLVFPKGKISYQILSPKRIKLSDIIYLPVIFKIDGVFQKKIGVQVNIEVLCDVVVANRPLARYKLLTRDDLTFKTMDITRLSSSVIMDIDSVLGKRLRKSINAKTVLTANLVESPPIVKRGDVVSIILESDGFRITAVGKIMKKGHKGEMLKVLNLDSKKEIYAKVIDPYTVKVEF